MLTEKESKAIIGVSGAKKASKKFGEKCKAAKMDGKEEVEDNAVSPKR